MPKQILFLSKGINASSTRYRALQYFPILQHANWEPRHHTISGGIFAFINAIMLARKADVVILLRKTFPYPIFLLLRFVSKRLVFDFDDAIFCNTDGSYSPTRMRRFKQTVNACDYIFAGNSYLGDTARQFSSKVSVIPTSVDTAKYSIPHHKNTSRVTLVWIGSQSTRKYIQAIVPLIDELACRIPSLELRIIADFELNAKNLIVHNIPWSAQTEAQNLAECHIGLAPLPEDNWTKGKCGLKVLQYMAAGLPVITSNSGVNREIIQDGVNGYVVTAENWAETIEKAISNSSGLAAPGLNAQSKVRDTYDISIVSDRINTLLSEIAT
jgi:glycosyltransferase involved in cell wall biosynthesis